jgi:hypothetical protein
VIGVIDGIVVAGASAIQSPWELPVRGYRGLSADARVLSIYEGANDVKNLVITRALARSDRCERPCRCEFIRTLKGGASLNVRFKIAPTRGSSVRAFPVLDRSRLVS